MKNFAKLWVISKIGLVFLCLVLLSSMALFDFSISIRVAPNVLNLQSNGQVVTVHTDVAYSWVEGHTVSLNGIEISSWKADNKGNFVAKFNMDEIKDLPLEIGGMNTLTLVGETSDGLVFAGSQDIMVVNNVSSGHKK